jgi:hypothetical protein
VSPRRPVAPLTGLRGRGLASAYARSLRPKKTVSLSRKRLGLQGDELGNCAGRSEPLMAQASPARETGEVTLGGDILVALSR